MKMFEVTDQPLSLDDVAARVTRPDCGGIALFSGTVRGETATGDGVRGTDFLVYEAYAEMAVKPEHFPDAPLHDRRVTY